MAEAPEFNRTVMNGCVKKALEQVADFPDDADIGEFSFQHFHDYHKKMFITTLKNAVLNVQNEEFHYDIVLNEDIMDNWDTVNDCISYLEQENILYHCDTSKVQI